MTTATSIDIVFDVICPWCYIGKRRLEEALRMRPGLEVDVLWRPFMLNPDMPPEGMDRAQYLSRKFGGEHRAQRVYDAVSAAGMDEGIAFAFELIKRTPSTVNAHRLVRLAGKEDGAETQTDFVEALFIAYFIEGRDIGERTILVELAETSGLAGDEVGAYLDSERDVELVHAENLRAHRLGINGVPCFTVNGQYAVAGAQDPQVFLRLFDVAAGTAPAQAPAS